MKATLELRGEHLCLLVQSLLPAFRAPTPTANTGNQYRENTDEAISFGRSIPSGVGVNCKATVNDAARNTVKLEGRLPSPSWLRSWLGQGTTFYVPEQPNSLASSAGPMGTVGELGTDKLDSSKNSTFWNANGYAWIKSSGTVTNRLVGLVSVVDGLLILLIEPPGAVLLENPPTLTNYCCLTGLASGNPVHRYKPIASSLDP